MNPSSAEPTFPIEPQQPGPEMLSTSRPFYWSVRRELWENRSLYIAPLVVASVGLFGAMISMIRLPQRIRSMEGLDVATQRLIAGKPYGLMASVILVSGLLAAVFYCLDALHGERRDRSILFWKSLPVSDLTAVLSKMSIPMALGPLLAYTIALITQLLLLLGSSAILAGSGVNPARLWTRLPLLQMCIVMFYGVAAHALWFAPIYGWLLVVSAWARRAPFLWAVLPLVAIQVFEKVAFGSNHFALFLKYRLMGTMVEGFSVDAAKAPINRLSQLTPLNFLSTPGLWLGLLFAAACLTVAVLLRQRREPI